MSFRIKVIECLDDYLAESIEVVRAFNPYLIIDNQQDNYLAIKTIYQNGLFLTVLTSSFKDEYKDSVLIDDKDIIVFKRKSKKFLKNCIYKYISEFLNFQLPYGSSTGVRPTSLIYQNEDEITDVVEYLKENYFIEEKRAKLLASVVENQKEIISYNSQEIDFFVNIPFCPSRCKYCSFISQEIAKVKTLDNYIEVLVKEIREGKDYIDKTGKKIRSIYVGGGTPTSLPNSYLEKVLKELAWFNVEFTLEAGRPDTINNENLKIIADNGVTRISVNPQTLNDKTLSLIGREHSAKDFYEAYAKASKYNFIKNVDIIVGLPGESEKDFMKTLSEILSLQPENLTIHTLSIKRGGLLKNNYSLSDFNLIKPIMDIAQDIIDKADYFPYYMYRQKNMVDGLENIGYAKEGMQCVYNIDIMEETHNIIGCGAGAMSKYITKDKNKIERHINPKDINYYIERNESSLNNKRKLMRG